MFWLMLILVGGLIGLFGLWGILKSRHMDIWIASYIRTRKLRQSNARHKHIYVCLADHYEPYFNNVTQEVARGLVDNWVEQYRKVASQFSDSNGRPPQHSYFYPEEEYDEYVLQQIQKICEDGFGDVDIHLHHDNDTAENLEKTLNGFKQLLNEKHNLLRRNEKGELIYGFIHGNWALDNSRPDGRWCGVNNEIEVLQKTGCVYDMTMPSAPSDTQTKTINQIYWAEEKGHCKSHDTGERAKVGKWYQDKLLMIQGPLMLNWKNRKFGVIPKIESSELSGDAPPGLSRVKLWEAANICVEGAEEHVFIKLHTHGLQPKNSQMFFERNGFFDLWSALDKSFKNKPEYTLHYVSAWEMYEKVKSLVEK